MPFEYKGATIRAREITIADDDRISALMAKAGDDPTTTTTRYRFAEFMIAASVNQGEPPLPMVTLTDSDDAIQAAFEAWGQLPRRFGRAWQQELNQVESLPNE